MSNASVATTVVRGVVAAATIFVVWIAVDAFLDSIVFDDEVEINWGLALIISIALGSVLGSITQRRSTE